MRQVILKEVIDFKNNSIKDDNLMLYSSIFKPGAKPSDVVAKRYNSKEMADSDKSNEFYRVRSGDTLGRIASSSDMSFEWRYVD